MNDISNEPKNNLLLKAVRHEPVPRVPVWMMRQAGRSDPEYMKYREQSGRSLYDLFRDPEHAVPISLLPQRFGVDAIIMFQDILTPTTPMGADFQFVPGPVLDDPIRSTAQVESLRPVVPEESLGFVGTTIKELLSKLDGDLPLLGFAGAPFTLAAFMIEGKSPGRGMENTLAFAKEQPEAFTLLMDKLNKVTIDYLNYQIESGVHAVQLFESVGDQIPEALYDQYAQPSHEYIFASLNKKAPGMLFVRESPFPDKMLKSGASVLSVGAQTSLADILRKGNGKIAVQGNVDNHLLAQGTPEDVEKAVQDCIAQTGGRGHILNLGHGLLPETPFENVCRFVDAAKEVKLASE